MIFRHLMPRTRLVTAERGTRGAAQALQDLEWIRAQQKGGRGDRQVLILGAGMAGLSSAYELSKLGFKVLILEADPTHLGGRVRTHRTTSQSGVALHAELGAMRIPKSHRLTNHYIEEFGLDTQPFVMSNPDAFAFMRGRALRVGEVRADESVAMNLYNLLPSERELKFGGLWTKTVLDVLAGLSDVQKAMLYADELTDPTVRGLDHKALATALSDAGLSHEAREYVMTMIGLETALPIALTEHLREENDEVWLGEFDELTGGTDTLATAFAERVRSQGVEIRQGCQVIRIDQPEQGNARAIFRDPQGEIHAESAHWMLCTIPLGVLNRLDIRSAFSNRKLRAVQGVNYDPSTKVIGRAPFRWWEKDHGIYGGGTMYDTQMGSTWYPADNIHAKDPTVSDAESLFLASYTWGQLARRVAAIPNAELDGVMREELGRVHTRVVSDHSLYTTEIRWAWDELPFHAGAYAFFMPGEHERFYHDLVELDGRVFLAGEHASHTHSWIQGAFESSVRAMKCLLEIEKTQP